MTTGAHPATTSKRRSPLSTATSAPASASTASDTEYLHLIVVHLHPHSAVDRHTEAAKIAEIAAQHDKLIAMGDFNTLSPLDDHYYEVGCSLSRVATRRAPFFPCSLAYAPPALPLCLG
jgi:endonuclease/exonuclease/phosphatase family metal-dependent hydrolase